MTKIERFKEIQAALGEPGGHDEIYWQITDPYGRVICLDIYQDEDDAHEAAIERLAGELYRDRDFMDGVINKISCEYEKRDRLFEEALERLDETYLTAPYCEIDNIEVCLLDESPEELLEI